MPRLKANNRYNTVLTQRFIGHSETKMYVRNVPSNFPTFVTLNYGERDESTYFVTGQENENSLVGAVRVKGVEHTYEPEQTTVDCLNWAEYFNQYSDTQTSLVATDVSTESGNAYDLSVSITTEEWDAGMMLQWTPLSSNTGAVTVSINGGDAIAVKKNGDDDLGADDILEGRWTLMVYDGEIFQLYAIGADGNAATIAAGTTTTGAAGSDAFVTNSGTSSAAVFDFTIPRGDKGDPGAISPEALGEATWILDSTNTNTYAGSAEMSITSYFTGYQVNLCVANANTGASSLNVDSLGAKTIKKNVTEDVEAGDIKAGQVVPLVYDGTNFQIVGGGGSGGTADGSSFLVTQILS